MVESHAQAVPVVLCSDTVELLKNVRDKDEDVHQANCSLGSSRWDHALAES